MWIERLDQCAVVFDKTGPVWDQACRPFAPAQAGPVCLWMVVQPGIECFDEQRMKWKRRREVGEELWKGVSLGWTQLSWLHGSMGYGQQWSEIACCESGKR